MFLAGCSVLVHSAITAGKKMLRVTIHLLTTSPGKCIIVQNCGGIVFENEMQTNEVSLSVSKMRGHRIDG